MEKGLSEKEILSFQAQRALSNLSKNFLTILEDLAEEYDRYFNPVEGPGQPPEKFLDEKHFDHLRKRVLDKGGDVSRDLLEEFKKYDVRLLTNEELQRQNE
jgi:hypothetical protein